MLISLFILLFYSNDYINIEAKSFSELLQLQGYHHAEKRFFQMELQRRAASGRLSEILGETFFNVDKTMRIVNINGIVESLYKSLNDTERFILEEYSKGVNRYISEGKRPFELFLLGVKPEPETETETGTGKWTPLDTLKIVRLMAWILNISWKVERFFVEEGLDETDAKNLLPEIKQLPKIKNFLSDVYNSREALQTLLGGSATSNSFVVSGKFTPSGLPILANDPHLELRTPPLWIETSLSCPDLKLFGVSIPGIPLVVIGHTKNISWGLTSAMPDDTDIYQEEITSLEKYLKREEIILIKGNKKSFTILETPTKRPVINSEDILNKNSNKALILRWTGQDESNELYALFSIIKSTDVYSAIKATEYFKVPGMNFIFSDRSGNIGYSLGMAIPKRSKNGDWDYYSFSENPKFVNPDEGFIVTANNPITEESIYITYYWEPPYRAERMKEIIISKISSGNFTTSDAISIQNDVKNLHAQKFLPLFSKYAQDECIEKLSGWNYLESVDSEETLFYHLFLIKLILKVFSFNKMDYFLSAGNFPFNALDRVLEDFENGAENPYSVDIQEKIKTASEEACSVFQSLPDKRWGMHHYIEFLDPVFGKLGRFFGLSTGRISLPGSNFTVNKQEYFLNEAIRLQFKVRLAPSTRQIVSMGGYSLSIVPYISTAEMWATGKYYLVK